MGVSYYIWFIITTVVDFCLAIYYRNKRRYIKPTSNEILLKSATKLAKHIRDGDLTSEEIVLAYINRIGEVNGVLNAVVDHRFNEALNDAKKIDNDIKNGLISDKDFDEKPFLGVPFTTKESTQCKGLNATFGLIPRKNDKAEDDAEVIKCMKKSGAILIGVTNVPQLNMWWETHNPLYGTTNNPYNTTRTVGGSTGGEASIIAACGSPIGVGTDIGGSIRIPSFYCGLFGHKSSSQLISTKGMAYRDGTESKTTMTVAGPMSRHAEDLIPGLKAILGPAHKQLKLDEQVDVAKLKYYYVYENGDPLSSNVSAEIKNTMKKVVNHLSKSSKVEKVNFDELKQTTKIYKYWLSQEKGLPFKNTITALKGEANPFTELYKYITGKGEVDFAAIFLLLNNAVAPTVDEKWALDMTNKLKTAILNKLGSDGVLLFTCMPTTAHYHRASYSRIFNLSHFSIFSALKLPVTQVPLGLSKDGLPLGIQVVAAPYHDHLTIAVAKELEKVFGGYVPPF